MVIPAQGAWAALDPLLATKLHPPPARPDRVPRPHLIEVLENALSLGHGLILVAAPAGFGKTTIVADWLRATERAAAWLSLDKGDSDPALFWRYVIAALQTVDDALGRSAQAALETPLQAAQALPLAPLVVSLINDLAQAAAPIALVLDDYHVIDSEPVHASLSYFVDHLPPRAHLIVATRADPPLDLPRRRSRNQVTELRVADLRFTGAEADAFLNARMGLNLPAGDVASLEGRTEGWIAGLQLAALSLRQQSDRHAFVAAFAGDDRYIADYLLEEILYRQPAALQTFLLQTAILERLCGPLCNAVTGRADSAEMLAHLEQANLFLDPLDSRRTWYRYHALFADLLRRRLRQAVEAPGVAALHRRASAWYEREGFVAEAVAAALAAPDPEYAADLLQRYVLALFFRSDTTLIHGWLKTLPEPVLRARPLLAAVYANTLAHTGAARPEALRLTGEWLCAAEDALAGAARPDGPPEDLIRSFLALSRAYLAAWRQDPPQQVIALTEQALAGLPPAEDAARDPNYLRLRSGLCNNLAAAYRALGDDEAALRAFAEARRIGERCGDYLNAHAAVSGLCQLLRKAGRLPDAAAVCREALAPQGAAETNAGPHVPGAGISYTALGRILLEWNDLAAAEAALTRGLALSQLIAAPATQHYGRMALAYLQQARGESAAALETIAAAERAAPGSGATLAAHRARLWLMQGALDAAAQWAQGRAPGDAADAESLALARVAIARRRAAAATGETPPDLAPVFAFLERQLRAAGAGGWVEQTIELLVLQALAHQAEERIPEALDALGRALALAAPGGYTRMFLDEGQPMLRLLARLGHRGGAQAGHIDRLLAAGLEAGRPPAPPALPSGGEAQATGPSLVEPLSPRELEVLQLLAAGASNAEIARQLVITLNTTKKHLTHIFGKLGVATRGAAVARARLLGLLPAV